MTVDPAGHGPEHQQLLRGARRIVVKVGSSLVTNEGRGLDEAAIGEWCRQLAVLAREGREVIMVSSGAVAEGMKRLGWTRTAARTERTAGRGRGGPDGPGADVRDQAARERPGFRAGAAHARRPGRPRALPQRAFHAADAAVAGRAAGDQRERHRRERRDQVRRQRHPGRAGGQPGGSRPAGDPDRPARALHRRPAPRPAGAVRARRPRRRCRTGGHGGGCRLRHRQGRHDHQDPGGQARRPLRARRPSLPGAANPTPCCGWPAAKASAPCWWRRRRKARRASAGWPTTCSCAARCWWTRARSPS